MLKNAITPILDEVRRTLSAAERKQGELLWGDRCVILSQSPVAVEFLLSGDGGSKDTEYQLRVEEGCIIPARDGKIADWDRYSYACLLRYEDELKQLNPKEKGEYKKYSRAGMIKRVLDERRVKAEKAKYRIEWAANIYGDHILINETGARYVVFLRDFDKETGYSDSADAAFNKLGTTKHIMYAFNQLKADKALYDRLDKSFPFIEIYCDPLNDYKISWFYPRELPPDEKELISAFFGKRTFLEEKQVKSFLQFIEKAADFENICIRPEVREKVERCYEEILLADLKEKSKVDFSCIKADLFPYQKEGINFALFRKAAVIADEMGLGKTIQAIAAAVLKKQIFGFRKTLVVCPATLKSQWKKEIEKFTQEKALILSGLPRQRAAQYLDEGYFFFIVNYETVLRDSRAINDADFDFLILDEAQKIKNYETKTASAVKRLKAKHTLVITGTPIENRLIDIYSIINAIDPYYLGPLWEFSYQHCLFDIEKPNKINGYYDLQKLNALLSNILIRREKKEVLSQLPDVQQKDVPVDLSPLQEEFHASYMKAIAKIIQKKFLTPYDLQRLTLLLNSARMVCDSTFLVDDKTQDSPKLIELKDILFEKLDIKNTPRKIIIFSEWIKMHKLIGDMLRKHGVGFTELNGKVPVKARGDLIKSFENNPECKVFLSTEAGGAGLNLQAADILVNFELPWNPAKKNQRIGRIDRLGQKSNKLLIYNLISRDSIEQQIAAGLLVKQSLFESVLSGGNTLNYVDFSKKGRSQFIQQLEALVTAQEEPAAEEAADTQFTGAPLPGITEAPAKAPPAEKVQQMEQVLQNGMQFLAGLFKMSTGSDLNPGNQKIEIDEKTGEVVMRFKLM
ncbi:MAG: DEAD/DEAH box helicase [Spirochaetales bacterium]|jgi:SNF2 family DNA or RNA helicase|nr:DEAD/DEAH box helicase [Spirochaetales bacterium]